MAGARRTPLPGGSGEGLEGDQREGVLDAFDPLDGFRHEVADVGVVRQVALDQKIVLAGGRIDFRNLLHGLDEFVGHLVGLAELTLDLNEDCLHGPMIAASGAGVTAFSRSRSRRPLSMTPMADRSSDRRQALAERGTGRRMKAGVWSPKGPVTLSSL